MATSGDLSSALSRYTIDYQLLRSKGGLAYRHIRDVVAVSLCTGVRAQM